MDTLGASYFDGTIAWRKSDGTSGTPSFTEHVVSAAAVGARSVYAIDVDGNVVILSASAVHFDDSVERRDFRDSFLHEAWRHSCTMRR